MTEAGERFWGRYWTRLYDSLSGNQLAAMPSLHFATSVMAAHVLSDVGRVPGAVGWSYAALLGFALVYLGEHYVVDLAAGAALAETVRRAEPAAAPRRRVRCRASSGGWSPRAEMARTRRSRPLGRDWDDSVDEAEELLASGELEEDSQDIEQRSAALLNPRRIVSLVLAVALMVVAVYVVFPKVVGVSTSLDKLGEATWYWIVSAIGFLGLAFLSYTSLFRGVLGGQDPEDRARQRLDLPVSWQITMSGFAATVLFSAAGAGGVALTYWALRQAGIPRRRAACRMVAFLVLLYSVYLASLMVFGILLPYQRAATGTIPSAARSCPRASAFVALLIIGGVALIPQDVERRVAALQRRGGRVAQVAAKLATAPATLSTGIRTAIAYVRHPTRSASAVFGALGWWTGQIGILWACFHAYGVEVPLGVVVQAYFVGMVANLAPSPAAGVGTVDAGLIGAFVLFGIPAETVFPAVLSSRLIGIWLPLPLGILGYVRLRRTVQRWREEDQRAATIQNEVKAEATGTERARKRHHHRLRPGRLHGRAVHLARRPRTAPDRGIPLGRAASDRPRTWRTTRASPTGSWAPR